VSQQRDYLQEALLIVRGASMLLPERQHLIALNESRIAWRDHACAERSLPKAQEGRP
jgi:hypothetical protein